MKRVIPKMCLYTIYRIECTGKDVNGKLLEVDVIHEVTYERYSRWLERILKEVSQLTIDVASSNINVKLHYLDDVNRCTRRFTVNVGEVENFIEAIFDKAAEVRNEMRSEITITF